MQNVTVVVKSDYQERTEKDDLRKEGKSRRKEDRATSRGSKQQVQKVQHGKESYPGRLLRVFLECNFRKKPKVKV